MKKLFFILLLLNIIFFLWIILVKQPRVTHKIQDPNLAANQNIETILLAGEIAESVKKSIPIQRAMDRKSQSSNRSASLEEAPKQVKNPNKPVATLQPRVEEPKKLGVNPNLKEKPGADERIEMAKLQTKSANPLTTAPSRKKKPESQGPGVIDHRCFELGPFATRQAATALKRRLVQRGQWSEISSRSTEVQSGYWVLYPPGETYEDSKANVTMLKSKGIADLWMFKSGKLKGSISLGLFQIRQRAERQLAEILSAGINAELSPWYQEKEMHWLRLATGDTQPQLESKIDQTRQENKGLKILSGKQCAPRRLSENKCVISNECEKSYSA